ncbi:uncharacterized protein BT62DRAFT_1012183 [Guyanagaster necrorhizus]|uniref:Uncharacterized protein n=1 Tax=Guyanagaster necrorhizus TaxID=856835 RepID=A0A9P7VHT8_9AGAR|nr:uncharacterized protein BT62DRAFT_1012183 [Guyanagaster necrorhizus MCA 3950]KAG7440964.1 hypothetical protein BT62DRAFT_1012183 [Guyanagaster necrorhizus MCA 3950]
MKFVFAFLLVVLGASASTQALSVDTDGQALSRRWFRAAEAEPAKEEVKRSD